MIKRRIYTSLSVAIAAAAVMVSPNTAVADSGRVYSIAPTFDLRVVDDDSFSLVIIGPEFESHRALDHRLTLPGKTVSQGKPGIWHFGGCSGPHGDGEVWAQVRVEAHVDGDDIKWDVHTDLYEAGSDLCGDRTMNRTPVREPLSAQIGFEGLRPDAASAKSCVYGAHAVQAGNAIDSRHFCSSETADRSWSRNTDTATVTIGWSGLRWR
ncbi:hypothetical protein [Streptomyces sp. NPDC059918]|uniref:hypothetical protein n=1 Tax=unclassified Streptomyces TaxID=2593676 RepID=UPI00364D6DA9